MTGRIILLERFDELGAIQGADGTPRRFRRMDLCRWETFEHLRIGDIVRFDDDLGRAINVEPLLGMPTG